EAFAISNLYKIRETLDYRIRESKSIAVQISSNPKLSPFNMLRQDYSTMEGIKELGKYKAGNEFIDNIVLHYNNHALNFTHRGSTTLDVLLDVNFRLSEEHRRHFKERLDSIDIPEVFAYPSSNKILYVIPLYLYSGYQMGSVIFE